MFDIQTQNNFEFNINGVTTEVCDIVFNVAKFDLSLTAIEYTDHLKFDLQYCTNYLKKKQSKDLQSFSKCNKGNLPIIRGLN